jgi:hypothetical protein
MKNNFVIKRTVHKMIDKQAKSRAERPQEVYTNSQAKDYFDRFAKRDSQKPPNSSINLTVV